MGTTKNKTSGKTNGLNATAATLRPLPIGSSPRP